MKTRLMLIVAFFAVAIGNASAQKVGYLNTSELLALMPEVKKADSLITIYATELQKVYSGFVLEYQQKLDIYQKEAATWSELKLAAEEDQLSYLQTRISDYENGADAALASKKEELYQPILDKVKTAIKQVGEEGKFTVVIDGQSLLYYGADAVDIQPLVKKKLGIQ